jgi:hypothetical protein
MKGAKIYGTDRITASLDRKRLERRVWSKPLSCVRGVFDKEVRRKPLTFAADAVISLGFMGIQWRFG